VIITGTALSLKVRLLVFTVCIPFTLIIAPLTITVVTF